MWFSFEGDDIVSSVERRGIEKDGSKKNGKYISHAAERLFESVYLCLIHVSSTWEDFLSEFPLCACFVFSSLTSEGSSVHTEEVYMITRCFEGFLVVVIELCEVSFVNLGEHIELESPELRCLRSKSYSGSDIGKSTFSSTHSEEELCV